MEKDSKDKTNNQKKEEKKEEEKQVKLELFEEEDYFEEFEDGNIYIEDISLDSLNDIKLD